MDFRTVFHSSVELDISGKNPKSRFVDESTGKWDRVSVKTLVENTVSKWRLAIVFGIVVSMLVLTRWEESFSVKLMFRNGTATTRAFLKTGVVQIVRDRLFSLFSHHFFVFGPVSTKATFECVSNSSPVANRVTNKLSNCGALIRDEITNGMP